MHGSWSSHSHCIFWIRVHPRATKQGRTKCGNTSPLTWSQHRKRFQRQADEKREHSAIRLDNIYFSITCVKSHRRLDWILLILQMISWLCCLQNLFTNKKQTIVNLRLNIDNILHTMCVSVSESILYFQKFVSKKSLCIKNHFRSFFISAKIFFF